METHITESRSKYEVADRKLDEAVKWLEDNTCGQSRRTIAHRRGTSIVFSNEEMFGGDVPCSWPARVSDFLELFCLPGSYATFRDDDDFCWYMAELKDNGKVHWSEDLIGNPFELRCNELEGYHEEYWVYQDAAEKLCDACHNIDPLECDNCPVCLTLYSLQSILG